MTKFGVKDELQAAAATQAQQKAEMRATSVRKLGTGFLWVFSSFVVMGGLWLVISETYSFLTVAVGIFGYAMILGLIGSISK